MSDVGRIKSMDKKGDITWYFIIVLILALPIALFAAILLPNEYSAQGIEGAVDCDGPIRVMIFAIPSYIVYGFGAVKFWVLFDRQKNLFYIIICLLCIVIIAFISLNVSKAYLEHYSPLHQQTCGECWPNLGDSIQT